MRARFDPQSRRVGFLHAGELVQVVHAVTISDGRVRVQVKPPYGPVMTGSGGGGGGWSCGWTSLVSQTGGVLLVAARDDPDSENAGIWIDSESV